MQSRILDKKVLQTLSKKAIASWLVDAGLDWMIMGCAVALMYYFPHPFTWILAVLVIGNRQHALVILGHDGTHYTLSRNKKFNDFLTNLLCFWPLGLTVSGYRSLHYKHHKHTGTEHDPELAHKRSRRPQWDLPAKPATILKYAGLDLLGFSLPDYWIVISYSEPDKRAEYIPLIGWHVCMIFLFIITGVWWVPVLWYVCLVSSFMMFFRLRLWLEHQGTSETHRLYLNFWQGALLAPHNSWMHWEHHNWPSVPYHRLPKLREHISIVPVMRLSDLIEFFKKAEPMDSGQILSK